MDGGELGFQLYLEKAKKEKRRNKKKADLGGVGSSVKCGAREPAAPRGVVWSQWQSSVAGRPSVNNPHKSRFELRGR
jgi:hypothetical protein